MSKRDDGETTKFGHMYFLQNNFLKLVLKEKYVPIMKSVILILKNRISDYNRFLTEIIQNHSIFKDTKISSEHIHFWAIIYVILHPLTRDIH